MTVIRTKQGQFFNSGVSGVNTITQNGVDLTGDTLAAVLLAASRSNVVLYQGGVVGPPGGTVVKNYSGIVSTAVVNGKLIITYSDGTVVDAGVAGGVTTLSGLSDVTTTGAAIGTLSALRKGAGGFTLETVSETPVGAADVGAVPVGLVDAKGDLIVGSANDTVVRRAVGANGTVLTADDQVAGGVKWATPSSSGGSAALVYRTVTAPDSSDITISSTTNAPVLADGSFDLLVPAAAGHLIQVYRSVQAGPAQQTLDFNVGVMSDVATRIRYLAANGIAGWTIRDIPYFGTTSEIWFIVQSGDVVDGNVRLQMYARTGGAPRTLLCQGAPCTWSAINFGAAT